MDAELQTKNFFSHIPTAMEGLFGAEENAFSALKKLPAYIDDFFGLVSSSPPVPALTKLANGDYLVKDQILLEKPWVDARGKIYLGTHCRLEAGVLLKSHTILLEEVEVRHGAYIRGFLLAGRGCVIGHATEIKNSILQEHVECGHFNYVGDSVIGSFVNLGAGSKLANLQFRSLEAKQKIQFPEIYFSYQGKKFASGFQKLGSVVGDGVEVGCNAVLAPAVFLGKEATVLPNAYVPKGFYPANSFIK